MENLQNLAIKSVFWIGLSRFGGQAISWSVTIILIRILSPEDYGLMGMALAYKQFIVIFFDLSIGEAVLQKKDLSEKDIYTAFWICLTFAVVLYYITWFLAIAWADFFSNHQLIQIVRVLGISLIVLSIKEIPNRLLARDFEFKKRSFFEVSAAVLGLSTSLSLALTGHGVWSLVIGEVVKDISLTCFILIYVKWIPKFLFSLSSAKQLLKYGMPVTGHYILSYFSNRSDVLIIGKLLGMNVLGYYSVALSVSRIPVNKGIQIIQQVLFPVFSKIQDDTLECAKYYYKIIYIISVIFFPVFLGMFAVSEEIIVLVLSPKWLPSLLTFRLFCIIGLLLSYTGIFLVILKSRGKTTAVFKYSVWSAIIFPVAFMSSSRFGLTGIACSWLLVFPILFGYLFRMVALEIRVSIKESIKCINNALIGSVLMVGTILTVKLQFFKATPTVGSFLIHILIGIVIYIGYFWLFSRETFQDVKIIWKKIKT